MDSSGIASLAGTQVRFDANGDFYSGDHFFWNYNNQPAGLEFEWVNVSVCPCPNQCSLKMLFFRCVIFILLMEYFGTLDLNLIFQILYEKT